MSFEFHVTVFRMIETHEPERAIELYKKACDVCEVMASNNLHVFYSVHILLCDYISLLTTVHVDICLCYIRLL